jgi:HEAT repeat protein
VQRAAAEVLARLGNADAIPPLLRKLLAENPAVRYYACRALASFPRPEVTVVLLAHMQDTKEEPDVRHQAAQSLAAIGMTNFSGNAALVEQLEQLLHSSTEPVSTSLLAGSALAVLGNHAGFDLAMRHATSKDVYLQGLAIITLGFIGDKKALPFLAEALQNGNKALRLYAAEALGRIGDVKALPSLYKALDDPNEAVREAARLSINKIRALETAE